MPMGVGGGQAPPQDNGAERYPLRSGGRDQSGNGPPSHERTPSYPSDEEKKPLPSSFEEDEVSRGYEAPPLPMKPLQGKQVFKKNQGDSMI